MDEPVEGVHWIEEDGRTSCVLDDSCFEPPATYTHCGAEMRRQISLEEDDDMLQYAITQSLLESGTEEDQVDIWEALQVQRPNTPGYNPDEEEKALQRAIQASLSQECDPELLAVIQLSQQQQDEDERKLKLEQETLDQVIKLSLEEK